MTWASGRDELPVWRASPGSWSSGGGDCVQQRRGIRGDPRQCERDRVGPGQDAGRRRCRRRPVWTRRPGMVKTVWRSVAAVARSRSDARLQVERARTPPVSLTNRWPRVRCWARARYEVGAGRAARVVRTPTRAGSSQFASRGRPAPDAQQQRAGGPLPHASCAAGRDPADVRSPACRAPADGRTWCPPATLDGFSAAGAIAVGPAVGRRNGAVVVAGLGNDRGSVAARCAAVPMSASQALHLPSAVGALP